MALAQGETLAAHNSDLNNVTGVEQKMYTPSFKYTESDSVTTKPHCRN